MNHSRNYIRKKLLREGKRLWDVGFMFTPDSNLNPETEFETADLRILVVFLSPPEARASSSTDSALYALVKHAFGSRVFMDFCFFPMEDTARVMREWDIPFMFGCVSSRSWKEYDVVMLSNAIVNEKLNVPYLFRESEFPLWHTERMYDPEIPYLLLGGSAAEMSEVLVGKSWDGRNQSFVDAIFCGFAEGAIDKIVQRFLDEKLKAAEEGRPPLYRSDKREFSRRMYDIRGWYYPLAYEEEYHPSGWPIVKVTKVDPAAPDVVEFNNVDDLESFPGFTKILYPSRNANNTSCDLEISRGCSSGGACSFCKEGHTAGGWREKSLSRIKEELRYLKLISMPKKICFYSYNTAYYSRYIDMIYEAAKVFHSLSIIGLRADVIGAMPEYFDMNKKLGMRRITFGVEGVSDRIRNGYLNKSLSREELVAAIRTAMENRLHDIKLYLISTGLEEKEDFEEWIDFIDELLELRASLGAGTAFRITISILTYYPETPIAWDERKAMLDLARGRRAFHFLTNEMKKRNIRVKFTVRGVQPITIQMLLDMGRPGTAIVEKAALEEGIVYYRNIKQAQIKRFIDLASERGMPLERLFARRPDDFIFPGSFIRTISHDYLVRFRDSIRKFQPVDMCLATPAKPKGRKCQRCGYCSSKEEIRRRTNREFRSEHTVDDVMLQVSANFPRWILRIEAHYEREYEALDKATLIQYALSRIVQKLMEVDESYLDAFAGLGVPSTRWMRQESQQEAIWGKAMFDVLMRTLVPEDMLWAAYEKARPEIQCSKITVMKYFPIDQPIRVSDRAIYLIRPDRYVPELEDQLRQFDHVYKLPIKTKGARFPHFKKKYIPGIKDALYFDGGTGRGQYILVTLPLRIGPHVYMSTVTGASFATAYGRYSAACLEIFKEAEAPCPKCGKGREFVVLSSGEQRHFCEECYRRTVLLKLKGR